MTKAVQISLLAGGLVATALIVGLVVFAATFNINDYKAEIARMVKEGTGRTLTFTGDIGLVLFPRPGVTVNGAELSNAPGFGDAPMARVRAARATFLLRPLFSGDVRISTVDLDGLVLSLARNVQGVTNWDDLTGGGKGESAPGGKSKFSLEVDGVAIRDAAVSWDDRKADVTMGVEGVTLDMGEVRPGAPFPVKGGLTFQSSRPEVKGSATFAATVSLDGGDRFGLRAATVSLTAQGAAVPGGTADVTAAVDEADGGAGVLKLKGLTVTGYGATIHFDGSFAGLGEGVEELAGVLTLDPCDGRKVLAALTGAEPDTTDKAALAKVGGSANVAYTPRSVAIRELNFDMDGNGLRGEVNVSGGDAGVSCYARLDADTVDADRYLPPKGEKAAASDGPESRWLRSDRLQRLTVDAEATVAKLHVAGVWMQNVRVTVKGRNGLVRVSPVEADLYGGKLSLAATVNALTNRPKTDLLASLDKVDVGALSRDALGDQSYGGILDLKGTAAFEGDKTSTMLGTMNGKFRLELADGVFPGVDLLGLAKTTQASQQKEGTVEASDTDSTRFGSITGTGIIRNGILDNRDLAVKAPGLRADGEGAISLPTGQINYLLKVKLVPTSEGQGGKDSTDMLGIMVPVRVTGTLGDPHYGVSLAEYVKALGGAVVGVAGTVFKGVTGAISTVGKMVTGGEDTEETSTEKKNGLHNLFGLF